MDKNSKNPQNDSNKKFVHFHIFSTVDVKFSAIRINSRNALY